MRFVIPFVLALTLAAPAMAGSATFTWDPVEAGDLAGYRLYMSDMSGKYDGAPIREIPAGTETATLAMPDAERYFVLTAFDFDGNESEHGNEVMIDADPDVTPPPAPGTLNVTVRVTVQQGE